MKTHIPIRHRISRCCSILLVALSIVLPLLACNNLARATVCPFCTSVALTFTDQLNGQDVVVAAKLLEVPDLPETPGAELPRASFEITKVLKGKQFVDVGMEFKALLVGRYKPGKEFLVMGVDPPSILWTTPIKASDRLIQYLVDIQTLPASGADRLAFFQDYFEDEISAIAYDAYDEFAKAPYADLIALKDQMNRQQLIAWVKDPELSINRRRLYLTMLGVCGTAQEADAMEEMLIAGGASNLRGLDALIASYLCLKGAAGVELVEEKFLRNKKSEFTDTMGAVSALRFHATEVEFIDRAKIVAAIRALLDRPKMADLIIPDLARWEDWSVMDKLVSMFKESDDDKRWLRVPIISYLIACPLPEAKGHLAELEKLDPAAVQRARLFGQGFDDDEEDEDDFEYETEEQSQEQSQHQDDGEIDWENKNEAKGEDGEGVKKQEAANADASPPSQATEVPVVAYKVPIETPKSSLGNGATDVSQNAVQTADVTTDLDVAHAVSPPNISDNAGKPPIAALVPYLQLKIIFIPLIVSIVLFALLWSVVSGFFQRLIF